MSRTFRKVKLRPYTHKWYNPYTNEIEISISIDSRRNGSPSIDIKDIEKSFYLLYRDNQFTSYKYYRRFEEQQYRTYCKRFIKNSLENNESGALKPVTKACRGYWD